jgi:30S ribosomal protein S31
MPINSVILRKSNIYNMGKGDIKTRRGKIANKSYGARRPKKAVKIELKPKKKAIKKVVKKVAKKAK